MKKNCMLVDADALVAFAEASEDGAKPYKGARLCEDGTLEWNELEEGSGEFSARSMGPDALAALVEMPLWEVVSIDAGGTEEFAILFYEN